MRLPSHLRVFLLIAAVAAAVASGASADQILENHDASLTTYLPGAESNIQDIRPLVDQRGVNIDGSLRLGSSHGLVLAGNPAGEAWSGDQLLAGTDLRLDTGTFIIDDVDLSFPADVPWIIGRSYNTRQKETGGSYHVSSGYQGENWFQSSQPELVFHEAASGEDDIIYLLYGADRFIEFRRVANESDPPDASAILFRAVNGAAGAILLTLDSEGPDIGSYYDQHGFRTDFFWFNDSDISDTIEGSIWRRLAPGASASNPTDDEVAYVGHKSNPSTALSSGYDATTGAITTAYDSSGRRFTYTYTSGMLTQVKAEVDSGGWTEVGKVDYSYYVAADSHGEDDDLELVTITLPLTDSGQSLVRKKYYWYYEGSYDAVNNPGYHHQIEYIIGFDGYRAYDWDQDSALNDDPLTALEGNLEPYASAYFEYDTQRRVSLAWFNGDCGCSGSASGEHTLTYQTNSVYSDDPGYDQEWCRRTVVERPDGTYLTQYFDEVGQPIHQVITDSDPTGSPTEEWVTMIVRNPDGQITHEHTPANIDTYTHSSGDITVKTNDGLVSILSRATGSDYFNGLPAGTSFSKGSGTPTALGWGTYYGDNLGETAPVLSLSGNEPGQQAIVFEIARPLLSTFQNQTSLGCLGCGETKMEMTYDFYGESGEADAPLMLEQVDTSYPVAGEDENGPGEGDPPVSHEYFDVLGRKTFEHTADGITNYWEYSGGLLTKVIEDVNDTNLTVPASGDFDTTGPGTPFHLVTNFTYDEQGRLDEEEEPLEADVPGTGRVHKHYYSRLKDGRQVVLTYNDYQTSPSPATFYGPVSYTVLNHQNVLEVNATVGLKNAGTFVDSMTTALTSHVDEDDDDPITAIDGIGAVTQLSVSVYDHTGLRLDEMRLYHSIPASGEGSEGTNFDTTEIGYDDMGRVVTNEEPTGTIRKTVYDTLGRTKEFWVGTVDGGGGDMVKTVALEYDAGNDGGNSYLTKRSEFIDGSTSRDTTYANDVRGNVLLQTNPAAPKHILNKYDDLGRLVAAGVYKAGTVAASDDPTTRATDRLALSETKYGQDGRPYRTVRWEIIQSTGAKDESLESDVWYDKSGRVVKSVGEDVIKTRYDRLGLATHVFTLASHTDGVYADAVDVTGDIVLVEEQTVYDVDDGNVLMTAVIERFHDDRGTGETTTALDSNADGDPLLYTIVGTPPDVAGRIQITSHWYDRFDRVTDTVFYGTNGGANFDRDGLTIPNRSDTELRTTYAYSFADGELESVTDPEALETRYEYDAAGRQTAVIANYVDGAPSADTDSITRYVYTDGLLTKMGVDLDGLNGLDSGDQITTYTYGTSRGTDPDDSELATGHLLYKVVFPDLEGGETEADRRVLYAYNAQEETVWTKDQAGNVFELDYDQVGRMTHRRVSTLASGDGAVRRISSVYDDLGRVSTMTQYDNAAVGSGSAVDEAKFTYADWGPISKFEQDHDSTVATGGNLLYDIDYTYAKATSGRNTLRRTALDLPDGTDVTYTYSSTGSLHDDEASRCDEGRHGRSELQRDVGRIRL